VLVTNDFILAKISFTYCLRLPAFSENFCTAFSEKRR